MSNLFNASPTSSKSVSPVGSAESPQQDFQLDPGVEGVAAPSFGLQSLDNLIESDGFGTEDNSDNLSGGQLAPGDETPQDANQINTDGELVQEVSESTSILLALDEKTSDPTPDSFLGSYWPYLMVALALLAWGIAKYFKKPAPSFKHHTILERQPSENGPQLTGQFKVSQRFQNSKSETETVTGKSSLVENELPDKQEAISETQPNETGPQPTGQFKLSQRFQNSKSETETVTEKSSLAKNKHPSLREANSLNGDRPADDEFDVEYGDGISDSDVIDEQEAADIVARVDAKETVGPSARFKTEIRRENVVPKDRV